MRGIIILVSLLTNVLAHAENPHKGLENVIGEKPKRVVEMDFAPGKNPFERIRNLFDDRKSKYPTSEELGFPDVESWEGFCAFHPGLSRSNNVGAEFIEPQQSNIFLYSGSRVNGKKLSSLESSLLGASNQYIIATWEHESFPNNAKYGPEAQYNPLVNSPGEFIRDVSHKIAPVKKVDGFARSSRSTMLDWANSATGKSGNTDLDYYHHDFKSLEIAGETILVGRMIPVITNRNGPGAYDQVPNGFSKSVEKPVTGPRFASDRSTYTETTPYFKSVSRGEYVLESNHRLFGSIPIVGEGWNGAPIAYCLYTRKKLAGFPEEPKTQHDIKIKTERK